MQMPLGEQKDRSPFCLVSLECKKRRSRIILAANRIGYDHQESRPWYIRKSYKVSTTHTSTLEYLITVQILKHTYWKTQFHMACKEGQFDVVELFKTFSINLNAQHVNGMTPFDLAVHIV